MQFHFLGFMSPATRWFCAVIAFLLIPISSITAEPVLQLYIEGASYDQSSETWVYNAGDDDPLRIWAIGAVPQDGFINNVRMSIVYDAVFSGVGIRLNQIAADTNPEGFIYNLGEDGSREIGPTSLLIAGQYVTEVRNGSTPRLGDGSYLPAHDEYGTGRYWQEFALGNFTERDTHITNFDGEVVPPVPGTHWGQIKVYEIVLDTTGIVDTADPDNLLLHFDLYDGVGSDNHAKVKFKFAPFSHDAEGVPGEQTPPGPGGGTVPTPAAAGMGLLAFGLLGLRRNGRQS